MSLSSRVPKGAFGHVQVTDRKKNCFFGNDIVKVTSKSQSPESHNSCALMSIPLQLMPYVGRREKTPTPKTRFSSWILLRTPGRFTTRPLPVYFTTKMSIVRPLSVLSKHEIGP